MARGQSPLGIGLHPLRGPPQESGDAAEIQLAHPLLGPGRGAHQGAGALHLGPRSHMRTVARQRLLGGLGMDRLQAGVQQIPQRAGHRAVAIHQILQPATQGRLGPGRALGEGREKPGPPRRRLASPLQHLGGEAEEGLEDHPRRRPSPPPDDRCAQMEPQTAGRNDDPHRLCQKRGVPPRLR
jgi:hypothetical protein